MPCSNLWAPSKAMTSVSLTATDELADAFSASTQRG